MLLKELVGERARGPKTGRAVGQSTGQEAAGLRKILTPRQYEVCQLYVAGNSADAIAKILKISRYTVKEHIVASYVRLGVENVAMLARAWHKAAAGDGPARDAFLPGNLEGQLTPREREIIKLIVDGMDSETIANYLDIAPYTVQGHRHNAYKKLGVGSRGELVALYYGTSRPAASDDNAHAPSPEPGPGLFQG